VKFSHKLTGSACSSSSWLLFFRLTRRMRGYGAEKNVPNHVPNSSATCRRSVIAQTPLIYPAAIFFFSQVLMVCYLLPSWHIADYYDVRLFMFYNSTAEFVWIDQKGAEIDNKKSKGNSENQWQRVTTLIKYGSRPSSLSIVPYLAKENRI